MKWRWSIKVVFILAALAVLLGCSSNERVVIKTRKLPLVYDSIYPYYVEVSALSQIRPVGQSYGGSAGHAVLFLKGAKWVKDASYPTITLCDENRDDLRNPNTGVGISVDKLFKNVNWIGVPTRDLFYFGNLPETSPLTREKFEATIRYAIDLGIFKGIEVHQKYITDKPEDMSVLEYLARQSIGTDYALNFGRSIFSVSVPVTRDVLQKVIDFLNALNREYATGEAKYDWNGYSDNCSHLVHNSLAAAGFWKYQSVKTTKLKQLFNLSVPANEFVNLFDRANNYPIENIKKIYKDKVLRNTLLEYDWLPVRHGALIRTFPVRQENEVYDPQFNLFVLELPILKSKTRKAKSMAARKEFTEIKANLVFFKQRYEKILNEKEKVLRKNKESDFGKFAEKYYAYIRRQLQDVNNKLAIISRN